jgi:hypothetical protein
MKIYIIRLGSKIWLYRSQAAAIADPDNPLNITARTWLSRPRLALADRGFLFAFVGKMRTFVECLKNKMPKYLTYWQKHVFL